MSQQRFEAHWGRLGQKSQVTYYDQATGIKKAKEKLKKGYKYVEGYEKEKGNNLQHFIFND
jgi:hypothetical protein